MHNQTPLIAQGKESGKWYIVTKYQQTFDEFTVYEKYDVSDRILEIITIEAQKLRESLTKAAEDMTKLRTELVEQERINEELEQENAILRHRVSPDKIVFNPQFEKLTKDDAQELHRVMTGEADREHEGKERVG